MCHPITYPRTPLLEVDHGAQDLLYDIPGKHLWNEGGIFFKKKVLYKAQIIQLHKQLCTYSIHPWVLEGSHKHSMYMLMCTMYMLYAIVCT